MRKLSCEAGCPNRKRLKAAFRPGAPPLPSIRQRARLFRQHDRDAVADRVGELGGAADQLLPGGIVFQGALGQRATRISRSLGSTRVRLDGLCQVVCSSVVRTYCIVGSGPSPRTVHLRDRDQDLRPGLEVGRLQHRLLLAGRRNGLIMQRALTSASSGARRSRPNPPSDRSIPRSRARLEHAVAVHLFLARPRLEVHRERVVGDVAAAVGAGRGESRSRPGSG